MIDTTLIRQDSDYPDKTYYPFYYKGLRVEQSKAIFAALDQLAKDFQPRQIIEIGSRRGGFTKILEDHSISDSAKIYSYDIEHLSKPLDYSEKVTLITGDCFQVEKDIAEIIKRTGVTLVFCDGGDKNREINVFSKYLKTGDLIFGHDYAPTREIWERDFNGKIWDWHETWDSAIEDVIKYEKLTDYQPELFNQAVWRSLIK